MSYSHYQAPSNYSQPHFWRPDPQLFPRPPTPCITPQHPSNRQPPIPPNVHGGQGSGHLDKVWEACIASQPKVEYDWDQRPTTQQTSHTSFSQPHQQRSTNQPLSRSLFSQPHLQPLANRQPVHPHFSQPQQALSLPAAELQDRVSRWSRLIPYPSIPVPEQQIVFRRLPVRSWRRSVPAPAWQPVPEPNPLHHNEALESPVVLLQAPKKRGRARGKRSKQPILRSSQMLNQVTRPYPAAVVDNIVQADAPFVNTNGRNHELSSPLFPTPPEIKMETPSDDPMSIIVKMPGMRVPGSTDWIDDSLPVPYGNDRSNPLRTPPPKPPVGEKTPFNDKNMVSAAKALWTMFQAPTTDYSSPSQVRIVPLSQTSKRLINRQCWQSPSFRPFHHISTLEP